MSNDYRTPYTETHELLVQQELAYIGQQLSRIAKTLDRIEQKGLQVGLKQ